MGRNITDTLEFFKIPDFQTLIGCWVQTIAASRYCANLSGMLRRRFFHRMAFPSLIIFCRLDDLLVVCRSKTHATALWLMTRLHSVLILNNCVCLRDSRIIRNTWHFIMARLAFLGRRLCLKGRLGSWVFCLFRIFTILVNFPLLSHLMERVHAAELLFPTWTLILLIDLGSCSMLCIKLFLSSEFLQFLVFHFLFDGVELSLVMLALLVALLNFIAHLLKLFLVITLLAF